MNVWHFKVIIGWWCIGWRFTFCLFVFLFKIDFFILFFFRWFGLRDDGVIIVMLFTRFIACFFIMFCTFFVLFMKNKLCVCLSLKLSTVYWGRLLLHRSTLPSFFLNVSAFIHIEIKSFFARTLNFQRKLSSRFDSQNWIAHSLKFTIIREFLHSQFMSAAF